MFGCEDPMVSDATTGCPCGSVKATVKRLTVLVKRRCGATLGPWDPWCGGAQANPPHHSRRRRKGAEQFKVLWQRLPQRPEGALGCQVGGGR